MLAAVPSVGVADSAASESISRIALCGQAASDTFAATGLERKLSSGETLIRAGDAKSHAYRVKEGLVCTYWQAPGEASRRIIGFSFIGDVVGLGALERHVTTVEAGADTIVQCLPIGDLGPVLDSDAAIATRHAQATAVELQLLKQSLAAQGRANTMMRLAALLTVLSSNNSSEGRAPDVITDDVTCGFVADTLGLDVGTLEAALVGLGERGLVEPIATGGLLLKNRDGLEQLAQARF